MYFLLIVFIYMSNAQFNKANIMQLVIAYKHHVVFLDIIISFSKNKRQMNDSSPLSLVQWLYLFWKQASIIFWTIMNFDCHFFF